MYFDTHSRESLIQSFNTFMNSGLEVMGKENMTHSVSNYIPYGANGFCDHQCAIVPTRIDEILFFHLARRLNDSDAEAESLDLCRLLTTVNATTRFFESYKIHFSKEGQKINVWYKGEKVDWHKDYRTKIYMERRLGIGVNPDYCLNGFAFRDLLEKNYYVKTLRVIPEFFGMLLKYLKREDAINDYVLNSSFYCFEYKLPLEKVIIEESKSNDLHDKQDCLLSFVKKRLDLYRISKPLFWNDNDNLILRLNDDEVLSNQALINKELFP